jgi:fatty-acid peroxygenase
MTQLPRERALDSTLALAAEGYTFISTRCRRHASDLFETRLTLRKVVCMTGEEASRTFYTPGRFTRVGAALPTSLALLQDYGSVQTLDGPAHGWRKRMFMSLMTPEGIARLRSLVADCWQAAIARWARMDSVVLHHEVEEVLCRAVCAWAAVPLKEWEARQRTREFSAMIDGAGSVGPRNWRGMLLRQRTERWMQGIVRKVRSGKLDAPDGSALHVVALHRDRDGGLLPAEIAAVEMLNVLRPTIAVALYVTFAALALHDHPECRQKVLSGDASYLEMFVQEVRRFYPFFPLVGGRVLDPFDWQGHHFSRGAWVLLDLYGTNHDPRAWEAPHEFRPERFRDWDHSAFNFIPQGGGDYLTDHRCAGEWLTIEVMKEAVRLLTTSMRYDVPPQDLHVRLSRMPAVPNSRFVITNVRQVR